MTPTVVLPVVIGGLYAAGAYLLLDRSLTRVLLGFLLLGNATNVLVLSAGGPAGLAPIVGYAEPEEMGDPLPQALVLTAIVITFGVSAFVLAVIHRSWRLVRQEVIAVDEEDRRVADRSKARADALDPDDIDPGDLPVEDSVLGAEDRPPDLGPPTGSDVEGRLARDHAGSASDDIGLPAARRRRR
ncbi:Na(+)/H(+) antiporter subunit C [Geodermatophilus sp. YIM 151500]|uniref:Na(+)/H(+) antiporter subunit C n=1 Tax=Geodermatophilus sp. YIM 151500 TaxID=2984531 RepID=UPI0021E39A10|nr:Na(+)/H(+) antiporter subunit C [Geodermatophilus sp. YIM 151500]MCV2491060.1 Na(+)/H(+) antiporter subunit C [Geodermatophilus sp. YIM 151500]